MDTLLGMRCNNPLSDGASFPRLLAVALLFGLLALGLALGGGCGRESEPSGAAESGDSADSGDISVGSAEIEAEGGIPDVEQRTHALAMRFQEYIDSGGDPNDLVAEGRSLVAGAPEYWSAHVLLGQILLSADRHAEAYEHLSRSLELDPEDAEMYLLAGTVALELDDLDQATEHYRAAVVLEPREARHRMHLAHAYMRQQQYDDARRELLWALRHDASNHKAHAAMADLYGHQNEITPALNHIRQALEMLPPDDRLDREQWDQKVLYVRRRAALLRRDLEPADALSVLRDLPTRRQFEPAVMRDMASCWAMLGEPERAAEHYEQALEYDPAHDLAAAEAANWFLRAERPDDARRMIARLARMNPRHEQLTELRERLEQSQGDTE